MKITINLYRVIQLISKSVSSQDSKVVYKHVWGQARRNFGVRESSGGRILLTDIIDQNPSDIVKVPPSITSQVVPKCCPISWSNI